jgi:predicted nucleic acid-binding protein
MYLLDTNACIQILNDTSPPLESLELDSGFRRRDEH